MSQAVVKYLKSESESYEVNSIPEYFNVTSNHWWAHCSLDVIGWWSSLPPFWSKWLPMAHSA